MIKDVYIEVKTNGSGLAYYREKGYSPENNKPFMILAKDLPPSSEIKVPRICDSCKNEDEITFKKYKPVCKACYLKDRWKDAKYPNHTECLDCGERCQINRNKAEGVATRCKPCHSKWMVGENNPNYGNGAKIAGENNVHYGKRGAECSWYKVDKPMSDRLDRRQSSECVNWRKDVYAKFNYTCDCCGTLNVGGTCEAHHLFSWVDNPDLRSDVENGVCLCKKCHRKFHSENGSGYNTPQQYKEFKEKQNESGNVSSNI